MNSSLLRSSFVFQILNQLLFKPIIHHKSFYESDLYKGWMLYNSYRGEGERKTLWSVIGDLRLLTNKYHTFPDTYFRFGMFIKNWGSKERMLSFVPQGAYAALSADSDKNYHILIDDKILFHDLMTQYGLPVPFRYFSFRNGEFRNNNTLLSDQDVDNILCGIDDERIFVKRFTGGAASGVSIFTKKASGIYVDFNGQKVSAEMIRNNYKENDYFFEKQIIQEPVLRQFNPDTVNTIRVLTFNNQIISATVRFGGKGSFVDNTAKGGVAVSLDINTGVLQSYGLREYDLTHYEEHPDSHIKFVDTKITQWPDVKAIVKKTLKFLPYYKSIGFDVATTPDGPVIIEINTGAGIYLSQMGKEFGLAKYFFN